MTAEEHRGKKRERSDEEWEKCGRVRKGASFLFLIYFPLNAANRYSIS